MKPVQIKICGMRDRANILAISELGPDFMGFIFYRLSPRFVGDDFKMPENMSPSMRKVGVFVNELTEVIMEKVRAYNLDYVQLHGDEAVEQCEKLRTEGVGVIKAFGVDERMDFGIVSAYSHTVDYFLFDTRGKLYGGNGAPFKWELLSQYDQKVPYFISGGLTPENVAEIKKIKNNHLFAVDVNSGVEVSPAVKDRNKIDLVMEILKELNN